MAEQYGVFRKDGITERAIFIIDREGVIRYIDIHDMDEQPNNAEVLTILRQIDPQAAAQNPAALAPEDEALPSGGIVMYCTSWCIDCKKARNWLEQFNLPYREVDINRNPTAAAQVRKWTNGYETTPTFDIDGTIVVDFDVERLYQVLQDRLK